MKPLRERVSSGFLDWWWMGNYAPPTMVFHRTQDFRKLSWHDGKPSWVELNFPSTTSLKSRKTLLRGEVSQSSSILDVERVTVKEAGRRKGNGDVTGLRHDTFMGSFIGDEPQPEVKLNTWQ